jgi:hypothetical protein
MLLCPFCQAEIDDDKMRAGRCSQCGGLVMWEDGSGEEDSASDLFSMAAIPRDKPSMEEKQESADEISAALPPSNPSSRQVGDEDSRLPPSRGSEKTVYPIDRTVAADSFYKDQRSDDAPRKHPAPPDSDLNSSQATMQFQNPAPAFFRSGNEDDDPPGDAPVAEVDIFRTLPRRVETHRSISVRALSSGEAERVQDLWRGTYSPSSSPYMTIKHAGVGSEQSTESVVVKTRVVIKQGKHSYERPDYTLLDKIGEGGVGVVYEATQTSINRTVAVKMLRAHTAKDQDAREKFLTEAVVTGELDHPNIVPVYDLGADEQGAAFYSMKRVEGTPWSKVIGERGLQENLEILMKIADAVAFAHARGVVHRDLKPKT